MTLAVVEAAGRATIRAARSRYGREDIVMIEPRERIRYDASVCSGDFRDVRERFDTCAAAPPGRHIRCACSPRQSTRASRRAGVT
ncbi:hypothetical protein DIE11_12120 [Burkholderia sp. Bp9012]|nr:hypothetical protein DIE11_12120 [Burkholderia sp. Bp9012]